MNGLVREFRPKWIVGVGGAVLALLLGNVAHADAQTPAGKAKGARPNDRISFAIRVNEWDPFANSNQASTKANGPLKVRRGEMFRLTIIGKPKPGFHTYPLMGLPDQTVLARLTFTEDPAFAPLWPVHETQAEVVNDKAFGRVKEHDSEFQWSQDVLVRPDATPGLHTLRVKVDSQACNEVSCVPFSYPLEATVEVSDQPPVALGKELQARSQEKPPSYASVRPPKTAASSSQPAKAAAPSGPSGLIAGDQQYRESMAQLQKQIIVPKELLDTGGGDASLLAFILSGIFWGAVSLVTPCVFPMIPITVSFFLKQSEKAHHRPVTMALVYCLTIVTVLTVAAVALLKFFQALSVNPWTNFGLGALFIFFALSLFGMYEIELPSGLARFTSEREGKGGLIGTIFMALTFTIISFACVAPFLGGFGGTASTVQRPWWHMILGGVAFSATFAAPFFILALFPTLLKKMPKSGSWLNSVKVVMGFLELAAALKFLRAGELANSSSSPSIFTFDFVLGLYVALSVLCGLYLLGLFRLPHDSPTEHLSVPRLMFSLLFLGLGIYLAPALFSHGPEGQRQRPGGTVYAWVDSFLLPEFRQGTHGEEVWTGNLAYAVERAREHLRRTGQPKFVFVDFTGKLCTNCKVNEKDVLSKPEIKKLFQPYELVQIYTDYVPNEFYSPEERARFGSDTSRQREDAVDVNLPFESAVFGTSELPLYVILEPRLDNTIRTVGMQHGLIRDPTAFAQFLKAPLTPGGAAVAQASGN